jgi:hypothetical protein
MSGLHYATRKAQPFASQPDAPLEAVIESTCVASAQQVMREGLDGLVRRPMPLAKALADGFETATRYARMASISPVSANAPLPRCEHDRVDATAAPHSRDPLTYSARIRFCW